MAEPNQALIVTGFGAGGESDSGTAFKIVVGKGAAVIPGFQVARKLSLDTRSTQLEVDCVTQQGIALNVEGVVIYKMGDDPRSIPNAARRWLDQQQIMNATIRDVFAGHLRSLVGGLTIEEMIRQRERLTNEVCASSADEMAKLGLQVDSLQIQEIDDATGYIVNLGAPHAAPVASAARIAEAQRDQEATRAEQEASALKAAAIRDAAIGRRASRQRSTRPTPRRCRLDRCRTLLRRRTSWSPRRALRSWALTSPISGSSRRSASRQTPRPTATARWPRPIVTRESAPPRRRRRRPSSR